MKKQGLSIRLHLLLTGMVVLSATWLAGCTNSRQAPPPIVSAPVPTQSTSISSATPQSTISDGDSDAVTFNPDEMKFGLQPFASGLDNPLFVTHAGDGSDRLFVVEKPGLIRVVQDGELLEAPFLDISDRVNDGKSEQGLLGLAFAPNYAENGLFFVNYTDSAGDTTVARYQVSDDDLNRADADTETIVLQIAQPAGNHNGGMIAFGPDGMLYVGTGDGGGANDRYGNGQNPDSLLGKLLRIDVLAESDSPYEIPPDNPWVMTDWEGMDVRDEVLAVGLRNPWRFSFDRQTGDLWIADVGQNQYEEINFVPATASPPFNFGWPIMEAFQCFNAQDCDQNGLWIPTVEIDHAGNCSVTGGYVYRGQQHSALNGVYLFSDYCSGKIWATLPDPDTELSQAVGTTTVASEGSGVTLRTVELLDTNFSTSSFGEDEMGELYVTDLSGGTVSRLVIEE